MGDSGFKYDKCLIATGGTPRMLPGVAEDALANVSTFRSVSELYQIVLQHLINCSS
jgi:NAD(P)H-nitrite reductase large subunit